MTGNLVADLNLDVERHYSELESHWTVTDNSNEYSKLVTAYGNSDEPFHSWFHLKEAFSHELLSRLTKDLEFSDLNEIKILDCFAGGGTTLVSAAKLADDFPNGIEATGIEANPFLFHVAKTKSYAATRPRGLVEDIQIGIENVKRVFEKVSIELPPVPIQSTWRNQTYFPPRQQERLMRLKAAISLLDDGEAKDVLSLCAAASVEPCSKLRRDGRALRYQPDRKPQDPWMEFERRSNAVVQDLLSGFESPAKVRMFRGDGRRINESISESERFDLILFSPPYPNNIDYTEIYKAEAWYLDCYEDEAAFRRQRLVTVRSHPSVRFPDDYSFESEPYNAEIIKLLKPLISAVPDDRYRAGRIQVIRGYVDDMHKVLKGAKKNIKDSGRLAYVVGNSVHGTKAGAFVIAADILMARIAELVGWQVTEIRVARNLCRRGFASPFLRETVVVLSVPQEGQ